MIDYFSPLNVEHSVKYDDVPRSDLINMVNFDLGRVLEIGCGAGATGVAIKEKFSGAEYWGMEINEQAASVAKTRLDKVITGNIEDGDFRQFGFNEESFDLIICADVLEHLYDPWKILASLRKIVKADGKILASIPNSQNIHLIQQLINGTWTYAEHGLLDATHIRFFTFSEIDKLFHGTGYTIINNICMLQESVPEDGWPRDLEFGKFIMKQVSKEEFTKFCTFQYLILAQKSG